MPKFLALLFLLLPFGCLAQFSISGKVISKDDKQSVVNASVFLNNATKGTASADDGSFTITNVKSGKYLLVVSVIGYEDFTEPVLVNGDIKLETIRLITKKNTFKEVVIRPDEHQAQYLATFKEQFLGKSDLADQCKILNPEVLNFEHTIDTNVETLKATSTDYLIIENAALGYRIKYMLQDFRYIADPNLPDIRYNGTAFFAQLPGTPSEQRRWQHMRQQAYKNSAVHFFRSLIQGSAEQEGFRAQQLAFYDNPDRPSDSVIRAKIQYYQRKASSPLYFDTLQYWRRQVKEPKTLTQLRQFPLTGKDILYPTDQPGILAVGCEMDGVFITYNEGHHFEKLKLDHIFNPKNTEATLIRFTQPYFYIDENGTVSDPYDMFYTGVWATNRMAEFLPLDYDPNEANIEPVDSTVTRKVTAQIQDYALSHVTEKAYLHFDKPYYAAGDTMYFKAYLTMGQKHEPSTLSGVLHVDLIDASNKIDQSVTQEVNDGVAWGDMVLPDTLAKGNYRVRAYTQFMRNENSAKFFETTIPVAEVKTAKATATVNAKAPTAKPDIQFFPEGGNLVAGVKSKVAFKAIAPNGLGIKANGEIVDNDDKPVTTFSATHLGMGFFEITPQPGKTYRAKVTYPNGLQDAIDLPAADEKGIAMSVDNTSPQRIMVNIHVSPAYLKANRNKDLTLIVYAGGLVNSVICKLDSAVVPVDILKPELRSGIARLTLLSPSGEPLSERRIFIQNYDQLKLMVNSDKPAYGPHEKVDIKLNAVNSDGEPVSGHFSIAVTDESKVPVDANSESTIVNNLLLTSDLIGYVEQPNYYFSGDEHAPADLDLLMLTQGYRGFEWKQVFNDSPTAVAYQPENTLELAGKVTTMTDKPVAGGKVVLLSPKTNTMRDTTTDEQGNFKFAGLNFNDTVRLVLHASTKNNSPYVKININKTDIPAVTPVAADSALAGAITPAMAAAMKRHYEQEGNMHTGILLKQVNIKSTTTHELSPQLAHSLNLNGPGTADQVILGDQLGTCFDFLDCLLPLLHGVQYSAGIFYSSRTKIELVGPRIPMVFIIDGAFIQQSDQAGANILQTIVPADISSIEVLLSHTLITVYGSQAAGGAIIITTKRGNENLTVHNDGTAYYTFNGYQKTLTFYSPKYTADVATTTHPDGRSTIYWQPEVPTDIKGNATAGFFNADGTGQYRVVVEGIDQKGNIGRKVYHYTVK